jgi:hypothetical protein
MKWLRWGPPGIFAFLLLCSILYIVYMINVDPGNSEFSGLPLILLTLPWSIVFPQITGSSSGFMGWAGIAAGALVNGAILWLLGWLLSRTASAIRKPNV